MLPSKVNSTDFNNAAVKQFKFYLKCKTQFVNLRPGLNGVWDPTGKSLGSICHPLMIRRLFGFVISFHADTKALLISHTDKWREGALAKKKQGSGALCLSCKIPVKHIPSTICCSVYLFSSNSANLLVKQSIELCFSYCFLLYEAVALPSSFFK